MPEYYTYEAFGSHVRSELELPYLLESSRYEGGDHNRPTVTISVDELPEHPDQLPDEFVHTYHHEGNGYDGYTDGETCVWFRKGAGTIRVRDGSAIVVSPLNGDVTGRLRVLILGPGFRTICHQQGYVVLHATTVVIDSTTVAFIGRSKRGKTTAAAACYARGHTVLADDITAVTPTDGQPMAQPGYTTLKLDREMAEALDLSSLRADDWRSRKPVHVPDRYSHDPQLLDVVYHLKDGDEFEAETIPASDRALKLMKISLSVYPDSDQAALGAHLSDCGTIASSVTAKRLWRPRDRSRLDEFVDYIEDDLTEIRTEKPL